MSELPVPFLENWNLFLLQFNGSLAMVAQSQHRLQLVKRQWSYQWRQSIFLAFIDWESFCRSIHWLFGCWKCTFPIYINSIILYQILLQGIPPGELAHFTIPIHSRNLDYARTGYIINMTCAISTATIKLTCYIYPMETQKKTKCVIPLNGQL